MGNEAKKSNILKMHKHAALVETSHHQGFRVIVSCFIIKYKLKFNLENRIDNLKIEV